MQATTSTGLPGIADVTWGTHCCHFYDSRDDLADTLVPYFKAGLDGNEACLWVTSQPLCAADARAALSAVVPDLGAREAAGQIEIIDHAEWYLRTGTQDATATLQGWFEREAAALARGYCGLRLTGNTYWLERDQWPSFVEYERLVNERFRDHRIVALCSYCFERCSGRDVLDVVASHAFAVVRRDRAWCIVENADAEVARRDLVRAQETSELMRTADLRKDQFIAMLGHELRNPLAPIATAVDLMRLRGGSQHRRELDVIERQLRQLTTIVDDLLDLSRITHGTIQLQTKPMAAREVIARAIETTTPLVEGRKHRLTVRDNGGDTRVEVDPDRMTQALTNLLANAAKYCPASSEIEIAVGRAGDRVTIVVADNGPGIPSHLLPDVCEPFVQGDRGLDRREGGLGLGLPIVKRLVELHRGTMAIESSTAGTTVTISLPALGTAAADAGEAGDATEQDTRRLLVVDDNDDAAALLGECLGQLGYDVRVAESAETALTVVETWHPDIAILDIGLPGADGYELARAMRRIPGMAAVRLIALTGYGAPSDREAAQDAGFDHHLTKPVSMATLSGVLRSVDMTAN